jgi:methionine aminotransferase
MLEITAKLPGVSTSIFTQMTELAQKHQAINLAQGFPNFEPDSALIKEIYQAMKSGANQYAPMAGYLPLREIIAQNTEQYFNKYYHPDTEITVTAGATQAIFTALAAFIVPGDEVIIFEPAYDSYAPAIKLLGGVVKNFELRQPHFMIDWEMVKKLFSAKTKMIIINSPHNPSGSILQTSDIEALIKLTQGTDILLLSDEVYAHLSYDNQKPLSLSQFPELAERAIIVSSYGKIFNATGWKIGYVLAPANLMSEFRKVHQFNVFSVNSPSQVGIAKFLQKSNIYAELPHFFQQKRDYFRALLADTPFRLLPCKGTYFQCVDFSAISHLTDTQFAIKLTENCGVAAIPLSAFHSKGTDHKLVRFCFAKDEKTLELAAKQLKKCTFD